MCDSWAKYERGRPICEFESKDWESDKWVNKDSYCQLLTDWNDYPIIGQSTIQLFLINTVFVYLLPVWAFLAFTEPHDCYKCLGKDPDRNFSIFQLSRAE